MQDYEVLLNDRGIPRLLFSQRAGKSYCILSLLGDWMVGYEVTNDQLIKDQVIVPFQLILVDEPSNMVFISLGKVIGGITGWNLIMGEIPNPKVTIAMLEKEEILRVTDTQEGLTVVEMCDQSRQYVVNSYDPKVIDLGGTVDRAFGIKEDKIFFFDPHNVAKSCVLRNPSKLFIIDNGKFRESKDSPAKAR